ncbi:YeaH/YhbH family protein [Microvirga sp. HBU67558]|uniref:YeaH/YhbH family protein n=1 Tax=Microvirga TaxID=186650 RepID=UPI001B36F1C7|nr:MULTISPECIES: YeaH/YhbH family protein [unclassified Microvirga]MBQ0824832.1 YeaH/YhbH family protein [Microvirga sp. HBU67558]
MYIIDRRLNPGGKSLANRQRFLRRAKAQIQRAVRQTAGDRDITDLERGGEVSIPADGVREPSFRRSGEGGVHDHILPGNKRFVEGDTVERPPGGGGSAAGGDNGEGEDDFRFVLTRDEFLDLFLDDLELPDLAKRRVATVETQGMRRAGYTVTGSPVNLALLRSMRNALSRRIAMRRPKSQDLLRLQEEIDRLEEREGPSERLTALRQELELLQLRSRRFPYIDPIDLRYRRFEPVAKPVAQAVMFCLMDVSGSMTEHMKDLAKRFYMLLYIFLTRRYKHVEIVFIRHTHEAKEVDEETFFNSPETGGTVVSSALREMQRIVEERYSPDAWNIYAAQASDGDNSPNDGTTSAAMLRDVILPVCQYYAYLEVGSDSDRMQTGFINHKTSLWQTYETLQEQGANLAMRKVNHRREIYPVFRELFRRRDADAGAKVP